MARLIPKRRPRLREVDRAFHLLQLAVVDFLPPFFLALRAQSIPDRDSFVHGAEALAKRLSQTQTVDR